MTTTSERPPDLPSAGLPEEPADRPVGGPPVSPLPASGNTGRGDTGRGWYPQDAASHRRDAPRFCPGCAAPFGPADGGHGIATEYWTGPDRVFACYCGECGWSGDVVLVARVVGHEPEH